MYKFSAVLAMALMVSLAVLTPRAARACHTLAVTATYYYSDATKTQLVGYCTITCQQFVSGSAYPEFGGGGTCSGTSSPYTSVSVQSCPCAN